MVLIYKFLHSPGIQKLKVLHHWPQVTFILPLHLIPHLDYTRFAIQGFVIVPLPIPLFCVSIMLQMSEIFWYLAFSPQVYPANVMPSGRL